MIRRTIYAQAIAQRAENIQTALGSRNYDSCLESIEQIRKYCDHLESGIQGEKAANQQFSK